MAAPDVVASSWCAWHRPPAPSPVPSSSLDAGYGFALQEWLLRHFKVAAILESAEEPWFTDARVKTCAAILQLCDSDEERAANRVRFVRFRRHLTDILGKLTNEDDPSRFNAAASLRDRILQVTCDTICEDFRVILKSQKELWDEGERHGQTLGLHFAGKWGRFLRAPGVYFEIMRDFGKRFAPLGEVASIRRGITSGCDDFFMPRDITAAKLNEISDGAAFRRELGVSRDDVVCGAVKIVKAGDGSVHPIESRYLAPEVHNLMQIDRPVLRSASLTRVVLLVGAPLPSLSGTLVAKYLRYGQSHAFPSAKSPPVPVPKRTTCAARDPWYDLTEIAEPGVALWSMSQHYRHIVAANPDRLVCNHNLFDINAPKLTEEEQRVLVAVLNCTILGLFKTFYGRYAGTEGNLKTEVVDVNLIEVPDPRGVDAAVASRILAAFDQMCQRPTGRLVEEGLMSCHSPQRAQEVAKGPIVLPEELQQPDRRALDGAVFEMLGVMGPAERATLIDRLYEETARHYRQIRVVEIEKMQQRSKTKARRFSAEELAADAWDAAQLDDMRPVKEWLAAQPDTTKELRLPEGGTVHLPPAEHMFDARVVYFGKRRESHLECASRSEAELVAGLGALGVTGALCIPPTEAASGGILKALDARIAEANCRFADLAASRTPNVKTEKAVCDLMLHWFVHGRPPRAKPASDETTHG